ncbi:polyphosphate kinase 2 family protein [Dichotomicrobium thermohalophilum]|uniref:PPK2 family polyphosphate:nucleotide phosphotransferase n=1 Tax=Dichotomicrobium thermohalophilum TaxID=933063 RepID=A0A397Q7V7_9HYPH|nr:polyphosphate kinase 2 family protein [Dichotomicrobium thermohalophilum]RIA55905.1 PPK2 family polyphosphate:nucleotide phosphotransferase [Dichotomicrobium thermohalophilum]
MLRPDTTNQIRAGTDGGFSLSDHQPSWEGSGRVDGLTGAGLKKRAKKYVKAQRRLLAKAQEKLYADDRFSVLILLQAMDAAGKDSTIKQVMSGVNPQGCQVFSFKQPSAEELDHNFLWRYWRDVPERGRIGIFNRSYYEEVLVVRVHPELVQRQRLPAAPNGSDFWAARFEDINAFERHMTRNGTVILKFFLNVSKEEQRQRFVRRLTKPKKLWKFSANDLYERAHWDDYQHAYEELITATSTEWAPWYVIPADNKWLMRALVSHVIVEAVEGLGVTYPKVPPGREAEFRKALNALRAEGAASGKKGGIG